MKVFIGCECSGALRDRFIKAGHEAISCDLKETEQPGPHHKGDMLAYLKSIPDKYFDIGIFHPPCTYLAVTANKWLKDQAPRKSGALVGAERRQAVVDASNFFMICVELRNKFKKGIAIENPVGVMSTLFREPDQIITPLQFGHKEPKKTCLWLFGLPKIESTHKIQRGEYHTTKTGKRLPTWYAYADKSKGQENRATIRSRTFDGIADAMVEQWTKKDLLTLF